MHMIGNHCNPILNSCAAQTANLLQNAGMQKLMLTKQIRGNGRKIQSKDCRLEGKSHSTLIYIYDAKRFLHYSQA